MKLGIILLVLMILKMWEEAEFHHKALTCFMFPIQIVTLTLAISTVPSPLSVSVYLELPSSVGLVTGHLGKASSQV
jgi:hypothetical protein